MFLSPTRIAATVHARLPDALRVERHSAWSLARGAGVLHSFLEGPAFDRRGNLLMTDVCDGRDLFPFSDASTMVAGTALLVGGGWTAS